MIDRIVIMRGGALGDILLLRPVLYFLKKFLNQTKTDLQLIAPGKRGKLLEGEEFADNVLDFESRDISWLFCGEGQPSEILTDNIKNADIVLIYGKPDKILDKSFRALGAEKVCFFSDKPEENSGIHASLHLWKGLQACLKNVLSQITPDFNTVPPFNFGSLARGRDILNKSNPEPEKYFVIHPGSGSKSKNMPLDFFADFAEKEITEKIAIVYGEADGNLAQELSVRIKDSVVLPKMDLDNLVFVLGNSCGYAGNDSGVSHLAGQCGIPVHVFFRTTDYRLWSPVGRDIKVYDCLSGCVL